MQFVPVDPNEIPNMRESHRGRVSYPILKSFLETNMPMVMLDRTGIQQSFQALYSSLSAYIRSHQLPIKLFSRKGEIYLARTDLIEGMATPENKEEASAQLPTAPGITADEVSKRFAQESGKVTK